MQKLFVILCALLFAACSFAQIATTTSLANATLPTYIFAGASYDQFLGGSGVLSGIFPESKSATVLGSAPGVYGSVTVNMVPAKYTNPATGSTAYLLGYSARFGQHKVLFNDGKNMLTIGGDVGAAFSPSTTAVSTTGNTTTTTTASTSVTLGLSGSFTAGYFRKLSTHLAVGGVIRFLYMPGAGPNGSGAFNMVPEAGVVWMP